MSHGSSRIFTDQNQSPGINLLVMDTPPGLKYSELTGKIIGIFYDVYNEFGHGFPEHGLRPQFRRLLFDNERKKIRENPCESVAKASA